MKVTVSFKEHNCWDNCWARGCVVHQLHTRLTPYLPHCLKQEAAGAEGAAAAHKQLTQLQQALDSRPALHTGNNSSGGQQDG